MTVRFVDTSVLCNLLPVPGKDQHVDDVKQELITYINRRDTLILPVTTIIETGNFIGQLGGGYRRDTAEKMHAQLELASKSQAPYVFHDFAWSASFMSRFLEGADTGSNYVDLATSGLGGGDLCILTEVATYKQRTGITDVSVWSRDALLQAHGAA